MATPINTGAYGKALWEGINAWFLDEYERHGTQWDKVFDMETSRKRFEEDVAQSQFGLAPVKPEGQPVSYDSSKQGWVARYNHVTYALGFMITEEMLEDDLYDVVGRKQSRALARSMRLTKETVGANVLNRAFNNSYLGGDNKELCATDHPNITGGTYQNELTTAADLSEAALEQALIDIGDWEDDRGLKIAVSQQRLILPTALQFEADRILSSGLRVQTADNDINSLNNMGKFNDVVINNYLTDADAWFIKTDAPDGLKMFERKADTFAQDNDFDTGNLKYKCASRFSFGWSDPKGIYGSPGA